MDNLETVVYNVLHTFKNESSAQRKKIPWNQYTAEHSSAIIWRENHDEWKLCMWVGIKMETMLNGNFRMHVQWASETGCMENIIGLNSY